MPHLCLLPKLSLFRWLLQLETATTSLHWTESQGSILNTNNRVAIVFAALVQARAVMAPSPLKSILVLKADHDDSIALRDLPDSKAEGGVQSRYNTALLHLPFLALLSLVQLLEFYRCIFANIPCDAQERPSVDVVKAERVQIKCRRLQRIKLMKCV